MKLDASIDIEAPQDNVWRALNDPTVLQHCIEGCESLEWTDNNQLSGIVTAKVGPVKARFSGLVTLSDIVENVSYTLTGEGKGGVAGFAKGSAQVRLEALAPSITRLHYAVSVSVGGKLAQLGARLIESTAKSYADGFFTKLSEHLTQAASLTPESPEVAAPATAESATDSESQTGLSPWIWGGGLIILAGIALWALLHG
jgi:uncharacterized protein